MSLHPDDAPEYISFLERELDQARQIIDRLIVNSPPPVTTYGQMTVGKAKTWLDGPLWVSHPSVE